MRDDHGRMQRLLKVEEGLRLLEADSEEAKLWIGWLMQGVQVHEQTPILDGDDGGGPTTPDVCTSCPVPGTLYFWYYYVTGTQLSPVYTLTGPIAVDYDAALDAWVAHYPQAYGGPGIDWYYSEGGSALKPTLTDCVLRVHSAEHHRVTGTDCGTVPHESSTPPTWIATGPGEALGLADSTIPSPPCVVDYTFWLSADLTANIFASCSDNTIYEQPAGGWAWTRATSPPPSI